MYEYVALREKTNLISRRLQSSHKSCARLVSLRIMRLMYYTESRGSQMLYECIIYLQYYNEVVKYRYLNRRSSTRRRRRTSTLQFNSLNSTLYPRSFYFLRPSCSLRSHKISSLRRRNARDASSI